jgi:excisionase family DNA binding protein
MKRKRKYPMPPQGQIGLSLNETCAVLGIGMTKVREVIDAGLLPAYRLGKKIIVRRPDADNLLQKLPSGLAKKNLELSR